MNTTEISPETVIINYYKSKEKRIAETKKVDSMKRVVIYMILSLFLSNNGYSNDTLSIRQMHEDVDFYISHLKAIHPKLYEKYPETVFDSLQTAFKSQCNKPMHKFDFRYTLSGGNKYLDSHTGVFNFWQHASRFGRTAFYLKDNGIWLDDFPVESINDIPSEDILERLDGLVSWSYPDNIREMRKNLLLLYSLAAYQNIRIPQYRLKIVDRDTGVKSDTLVLGVFHKNKADYVASYDKSYSKTYHKQPCTQRFFPEESIAVFYYNSSRNEYFEQLQDSVSVFFDRIRRDGIKYLFIDVSQNAGGSDHVNEILLKYLPSKPYKYKVTLTMKPEACEIWTKQATDIFDSTTLEAQRSYYYEHYKNGELTYTSKKSGNKGDFKGKVFVIMGPNTYSSGFSVCERAKLGQSGVLVGETSGQIFPFAGNTITEQLPNSEIYILIPTKSIYYKLDFINEDGFSVPDIHYDLDHIWGLDDYKKIINLSLKDSGAGTPSDY